ncbi:unnamed protein product [Cyclocybe aegerita]|uniref:Uncharacterized protein n=1 Tax=Cyclocybe aegerita TaxID=1973307 RepID=A0A8S0XSN3_CYCAE|nr:unnamed protein product [Cyclocybe aegerita]
MPRAIEPPSSIDVHGFRDFVPDEDAANFNSALWETIDQDAFIRAQQEAIEAFNIAKALKVSQKTAAQEQQMRNAAATDTPVAVASLSTSASTSAATTKPVTTSTTASMTTRTSPAAPAHQIWLPESMNATGTAQAASSSASGNTRAAQSQPLSIKKDATSSDEAAARSLARSWQVEAIQPALLLEARAATASTKPSTSTASSSPPASTSTSASMSNSVLQDKRAPASASKSPSQNANLSLSTSSASASASASTSSHAQGASESSYHSRTSSSHSQSHVNSTSASQAHRSALSKRDPSTEARGPTAATTAAPSASSSARAQSSTSTPPDASKNASQQRRRGERKMSFSVSSSASSAATQTQGPPTAQTSHFSTSQHAYTSVSPSASVTPSVSTSTSTATTTNTYQQPNTSASYGQGHKGSSSGSSSSANAQVAPSAAIQPTSASTAPAVARPPRKMSSAARDGGRPALVGKEKEKEVPASTSTPSSALTSVSASASASQQRPRRRSAPETGQEAEQQQQGSRKERKEKEKEAKREEHPFDVFTATRPCAKCGMDVESPKGAITATPDPFSLPFADRLHLTCTGCGTVHCRGCFKVVQCSSSGSGFSTASGAARAHSHSQSASNALALTVISKTNSSTTSSKTSSSAKTQKVQQPCSGGPGCAVRTCCLGIRTVAIFEALASFDEIFALEAGFIHTQGKSGKDKSKNNESTKAARQAYVKLLISKADKSMRRFEDAFVRTLKILCSWLRPPIPAQAYPSSWPSTTSSTPFHPATSSSSSSSSTFLDLLPPNVAHLFHASYLPEVLHAFLSNMNVRDWIAHAETYFSVIEVVRRLSDAGLAPTLLALPMRRVERGAGLGGWVWGVRGIEWEVLEDERERERADEARGPPYLSAQERAEKAAERAQERAPLSELVKQLERHRSPLMALAEKVQFAGTVEKVNLLCDGISYLLLQQVVGGL